MFWLDLPKKKTWYSPYPPQLVIGKNPFLASPLLRFFDFFGKNEQNLAKNKTGIRPYPPYPVKNTKVGAQKFFSKKNHEFDGRKTQNSRKKF